MRLRTTALTGERAFEERREAERQVGQEERAAGRSEPYRSDARVCEAVLGDGIDERQVSPLRYAGMGVATEEQELEDQDCQPERIVIDRPECAVQAFALQFGRRELRDADATGMLDPPLEAVGIDQRHDRAFGYQHAGCIDVADDCAGRVEPPWSSRARAAPHDRRTRTFGPSTASPISGGIGAQGTNHTAIGTSPTDVTSRAGRDVHPPCGNGGRGRLSFDRGADGGPHLAVRRGQHCRSGCPSESRAPSHYRTYRCRPGPGQGPWR